MLKNLVEKASTIAIGGHIRPDGDCVGSCVGLYQYLTDNYGEKEIDIYLEDIPEALHLIPGTEKIKHEIPEGKVYDLFLALDCGDIKRLGFSQPLFENAKDTVCIDHHISNEAFAEHNYIVADASSTSELVYNLLDKEKITREIAEALYVGIVHDTGVFQYSCTAPSTFRMAAELLEKGVDAPALIEATYYEKSYAQNQVLGRALLESMLLLDGRCIVSYISKSVMDFYGVEPKELDGIVSQLRVTKGTEVAVFMYETAVNQWKVSLRSKKSIDVSRTARYFGGGGHVRAAGFSMPGTLHDVVGNVARQLELQFDETEEA